MTDIRDELRPVWLSFDDLRLIERGLKLLAESAPQDSGMIESVATLKRHFDWVEDEIVAERTAQAV